jgi:protein-L-isoaspartate(D-aspartate) O-methyltransferase
MAKKAAGADRFKEIRAALVKRLVEYGYIRGPNVEKIKNAMLKIRREDFVLPDYRGNAYDDNPLPIVGDATISAPHMHAMYLSAAELTPGDSVLEIGAGSGILLVYVKEIVGPKGEVVGVEIVPEVYSFAKNNLEKTGYDKKVKLVLGDGSKAAGKKKFDKILISATAPEIPKSLIGQLKPGGMIIAPVGEPYGRQELVAVQKTKEGKVVTKNLGSVIFVPLKGEYGWK